MRALCMYVCNYRGAPRSFSLSLGPFCALATRFAHVIAVFSVSSSLFLSPSLSLSVSVCMSFINFFFLFFFVVVLLLLTRALQRRW